MSPVPRFRELIQQSQGQMMGRLAEARTKFEAPGVIGGDWKVARRGFALV